MGKLRAMLHIYISITLQTQILSVVSDQPPMNLAILDKNNSCSCRKFHLVIRLKNSRDAHFEATSVALLTVKISCSSLNCTQSSTMQPALHRETQERMIFWFVYFSHCSLTLEMTKYKITHATKHLSIYTESIFNINAFIADSQVIGIGFISPI